MSAPVMLLGRILASAIFIEAGYSALQDMPATAAYYDGVGIPLASLAVWPATMLELGGGILILIGLFTRPVAVLLAIFAVVAAAIGHRDFASLMQFQAFMKDLAISGGYLFLAVNGPGKWSVDGMIGRA